MSFKLGFQAFRRMSTGVPKINSFDRWVQQLKMNHNGNGSCTAEFLVTDEHLNRAGILHGGVTATLLEVVTADVVLEKKDNPPGPVSLDFQVKFLKPAHAGDEVVIDVITVHGGRRLSYMECEMRNKKDNSVIARGKHTVFFSGTK